MDSLVGRVSLNKHEDAHKHIKTRNGSSYSALGGWGQAKPLSSLANVFSFIIKLRFNELSCL